jgi:hypothetical protein
MEDVNKKGVVGIFGWGFVLPLVVLVMTTMVLCDMSAFIIKGN